jgi:hypothetical protein
LYYKTRFSFLQNSVVDRVEKTNPQGLKPNSILGFCGTTEVVPFHETIDETRSTRLAEP